MKNNKDNIRCFKFFGKFAWQNDKKYYAFLILNIIVNSLSPFVTILGTQYLIDEIADESKRNMFWIVFWVAFICIGSFICSNLKKWTGENISPISDTTIMSSAGAQCEHTNHVSTQIPYAVTVAVISFITYIIAGALQKAAGLGWLALPIGIILMVATVVGIKVLTAGKEVAE